MAIEQKKCDFFVKYIYIIEYLRYNLTKYILFGNGGAPYRQTDGIREEVVVATQKYTNGYYEGDIVNEERQGKGTYYWKSGNKYQGDWVSGDMHGYGVYYYANGCRYAGDFRFNDREGRGVFTFADGSYYDGDFRYDAMYGEGVYRYADGASYKGHVEYGVFTGYGIYHWTNGDWYEGQWAKGVIHGKGTYHFGDGSWVNGLFENNKLISSTRLSQEKSANVAARFGDKQTAAAGDGSDGTDSKSGVAAGVVAGAAVTGAVVNGKTRNTIDNKQLASQEKPQRNSVDVNAVQSTGKRATNKNIDIPDAGTEQAFTRNVIEFPQGEVSQRGGVDVGVALGAADGFVASGMDAAGARQQTASVNAATKRGAMGQAAGKSVAVPRDGMHQAWWSSHMVRDYVSRERGLEAVTDGSDAVYRHSKTKREGVLTEPQADFSNRMVNLNTAHQGVRYNAAAYGARTATRQRNDVVIGGQPVVAGGDDLSRLPVSNTPSKRALAKEAKRQAKQARRLEKQAKRSKNAEALYQADTEQCVSLDGVNAIGGRYIKREQKTAQSISDRVTPSAFSIKKASMSAENAILQSSAAELGGKAVTVGSATTTIRRTNSVATPDYKRSVKPVERSERAEIELVQTHSGSKKKKNKKNKRALKKVAIYGRGSSPMQKEKLSNFLADYIDGSLYE